MWAIVLHLVIVIEAQRYDLNESHWRQCLEVMGIDSWLHFQSALFPTITLRFGHINSELGTDPIVSVAIFHKTDGQIGGVEIEGKMRYICDETAISSMACSWNEYGSFIGRLDEASYPILTEAVHLLQFPGPIRFPIFKSGVYCVEAVGYSTHKFNAVLHYESKYGGLPAIQVGKWHFALFVALASLSAAISHSLVCFYQRKHDKYAVLALLLWLVTAQSAIAWTNLSYISRHDYRYECQYLRNFAIIMISLRNIGIVFFYFQSLKATDRDSGRFMKWVLAVATFGVSAAKENEVLHSRDELRDGMQLLWALIASFVMFCCHVEGFRKAPSSANPYLWRIISAVLGIWILLMTAIDGSVLWSWNLADGYGHDMLTRIWWARWIVVDEWQTMVYLADIVLVVFTWSDISNISD